MYIIPNSKFQIPNSIRGQSLIEILVAVAVISILLIGGAVMIISILKINEGNLKSQTAHDLSNQLLDNVKAITTTKWQNLYDLSPKGSSVRYYVTSTLNGFATSSGEEVLDVDGASYTRFFYVENVCRDNSGGTGGTGSILGVSDTSSCPNGSTEDPSTQRVTVRVIWSDTGDGEFLSEFFTRFENASIEQSSWSGGPSGDTVAEKATTTFASSTNIDYSSSTGAIQLQNP